MSDKELEEYLKKIEPNFDSHIEKGTIEMSNEYYNLLEERMVRLLNENKQLKETINKVREYIKEMPDEEEYKGLLYDNEEKRDLLKILGDKE